MQRHLGRHDHDGVVERCGSPGEPGTAAARDEGTTVSPRDPNGRGNFFTRPREAHGFGATGGDTRVARIQGELERLGTRTIRTDRGSEIGNELVV